MSRAYDIAIVGAGPAGLIACRDLIAAQSSLSILLIEKSDDYAKSVVCGEGVWLTPFKKYLPLREEWFRHRITEASFHSPDRNGVILPCDEKIEGRILHRAKMQEELLAECAAAESVTLLRGLSVRSVVPGALQHLTLSDREEVTAKIVLDCSGPASKLGDVYGLQTKPAQLEAAMYAVIDGDVKPKQRLELHRSTEFGEGGYYWHFPHGKNSANVGIVYGRGVDHGKPRQLLLDSIAKYYPDCTVREVRGGAIPNYTKRRPLTASGFIQCGDAAELVNPLTRSGITEAMLSGRLAAVAATAFCAGGTKDQQRALQTYERDLWKRYGKTTSKAARFKQPFYSIDPAVINRAIARLNKIPAEQMSMAKIMRAVVGSSLRLLLLLRHLV